MIITGKRAARKKPPTRPQRDANKLVSRERAANEHAFSDLKNWVLLSVLWRFMG